jgi:hypothetical protein
MDEGTDPLEDRREPSGLTRRTLLGAGAATATLAALGLDFAFAPTASADGPTSAADVIALGRSYMGQGLTSIRPTTTAPWNAYPNADWCAWFVSWISRGLGYGYQTFANAWDGLPNYVDGQAQVGDFARIGVGAGAIHVGIVTEVSNGWVTKILDGNRIRPPATDWSNSYVREEGPYAPPVMRRPTYPNSGPSGVNSVRVINTVLSGSTVDFLVGPQFIFRSPDAGTTNMMIAVWGSSKYLNGATEVNWVLKSLGVPANQHTALSGGQAWSYERGVFTT